MTTNQIITLLDVLSFLFVTTDLYGAERLHQSSDNVKNFFSKLTTKLKPFLDKAPRKIAVILAILILIAVFVESIFNQPEFSLGDFLLKAIIAVVVSIIFLPAFIQRVQILIYILFSPLFIAKFTMDILIWGLEKMRLKGILLFVGTILFIVGKILQYFA